MTEFNRTEAARALLSEIYGWCGRTTTPQTTLGHVLFLHPGFVGLMAKRLTVSPEKEVAVRDFMAAHPDGWRGILPLTHGNGTQPVGRASSPATRRREVEARRRFEAEEEARRAPRADRDPCPRCGARGDFSCGHSPTPLGMVL